MNAIIGRKKVHVAVFSAFLLVLSAQSVMAQSQYISGTVVDSTSAIVQQASVKIVDVAKGNTVKQISTGDSGRFQAIGVEPGRYSIRVEKTGFKTVELTVDRKSVV